jgi:uncharacterized membrane protein YhaH (DUF805 family)
MTFGKVLGLIWRGLHMVNVFSGRDTRPQFWPYAGIVTLLVAAFGGVPLYVRLDRLLFGFEGMTAFPGASDWADFLTILYWAIGLSVLAIALLASAVTRRLHDRDQPGSWGLMPLPFLVFGWYAMLKSFGALASPNKPEADLFLEGFLSLVLYLGALGFLATHLAGPSTHGPNRYGPDVRE